MEVNIKLVREIVPVLLHLLRHIELATQMGSWPESTPASPEDTGEAVDYDLKAEKFDPRIEAPRFISATAMLCDLMTHLPSAQSTDHLTMKSSFHGGQYHYVNL